MVKRSFVPAVISLVVALVITTSPAFAAQVEVVVSLGSLRSAHITVNRGDHVTWRNASGEKAHLAFAAGPDVPRFWIEGTATVTFDKPGTYEYYVHQPQARILHGTVTVK
jgi:plastocyanin